MSDILALILLLVVLFGCKITVDYQVDGQRHQLVLNPDKDGKP